MRVTIVVLLLVHYALSLNNGLVRTPPMGWLAWERYRCNTNCAQFPDDCIGEKLFMRMADRLVSDGWRDVGYEYVNIDDCWPSRERDANGRLVGNSTRFPSGIKALADYVHSKGLKLGIYSDCGKLTCGGYIASGGNEKIDAETFAAWGVDMLKYDGCYSNETSRKVNYPLMGAELNKTGRPIVYSCSWPAYEGGLPPKVNYTELNAICNLWRNYGDIQDSWDDVVDIMNWWGDNQDVLIPAAGPGGWNDPDMLIGGDYTLSLDQTKTQFGMWAMLAAPLFMSNDLSKLEPDIKTVLQNRDVIAVNQDVLGVQGRRFIKQDSIQVFSKPLDKGEFAVAAFSTRTDGTPHAIKFSLNDLKISGAKFYSLFDLFESKHLGKYSTAEELDIYVDPNGISMFRASPISVENIFVEEVFEINENF
uniref:alpha-N-acetylgalactosaminidase-like n=1 Tax=Ciona intestinalis TaxID=7719 RepID=UPI000180B113|nr:alpha-N-acetylgalactosaminidase-like [Ciona intestinalis]XP_026695194.1 alpha-N-acetylgalactosaminidase-like [Ciona intestinalis]|eukprot:XP_002130547.1 alpha-N-acetylgalactosaminidase-like [Ciona intestinalis]